ncbi:hypothetical protein AB0C77_38435, partial [Streptomyces sp. NPDC048629]
MSVTVSLAERTTVSDRVLPGPLGSLVTTVSFVTVMPMSPPGPSEPDDEWVDVVEALSPNFGFSPKPPPVFGAPPPRGTPPPPGPPSKFVFS